jgi:hypothetical protein
VDTQLPEFVAILGNTFHSSSLQFATVVDIYILEQGAFLAQSHYGSRGYTLATSESNQYQLWTVLRDGQYSHVCNSFAVP